MKTIPFLFTLVCFTLSSQAQTYEQQYEACSVEIHKLKTIDEHYLALVDKRDSCLQGAMAPDFRATSIEGNEVQLFQLRGKVVVLNFWYTACKPCIEEMPALNKVVKTYANQDVVFLSFAPEDVAELKTFFKRHTFLFTHFSNQSAIGRDVFKLFNVRPYAIIIDKEGRIAKMWSGADPKTTFAKYDGIIKHLLK